MILLPEARMILGPALDLIGRDISFTGRDVLRLHAIQDFKMHPLLGNGILTEYRLATGVMQDNAHSQFLELLAKYGLMVFLPFVMMPVVALARAIYQDRKNKKIVAIKSAICFMILFHSIVDHMMMYHYILLMVSLELLSTGNSKIKTTHSKRYRWIKAL